MQPVLGEDFERAKASGMADEGRGQGLKWREDETFQKQNKREKQEGVGSIGENDRKETESQQ